MEEDKTFKNIMDDDFGKIISKIRKDKNLTQKELADLINVSDRTISKWENGQSVPDLICIKNMCKALEISPSSLVLDKKTKKEHLSDVSQKIRKYITPKFIYHFVFGFIFIFLLLFYITNYNTVEIYKLKLTNDDFIIGNSYFIKTKYKNILVIDDIQLTRNADYDKVSVKLYTIVNGAKKVICEKDSLENIYIDKFEEKYQRKTKDIINSISKHLYIVITITKDNNVINYEGEFSIVKKYQNNSILNNNINEEQSSFEKDDDNKSLVNKKLIELGYKYNSNEHYYIKSDKEKIIEIFPSNMLINLYDKSKTKITGFYYDKDFISYCDNLINIKYYYYLNDNSSNCIIGKCKNYYNEIDEILSIYAEIKDIL